MLMAPGSGSSLGYSRSSTSSGSDATFNAVGVNFCVLFTQRLQARGIRMRSTRNVPPPTFETRTFTVGVGCSNLSTEIAGSV